MKSERMKKWVVSAVFSLLGLVAIGYSIKLTYDVMVILFPNNAALRFMAIALFDGGVIGWLLAYIGNARGTPQRAISLLMAILDFLGVAAMATAGVYLSGQTLADIPAWVGNLVVVVTVAATVLNCGAYYYYHANSPETREEIQAQELEDTLAEEALDQARQQVEQQAKELGAIIANRVTARLKYRLRLPMNEREHSEWKNEIIEAPAYDTAELPPPPAETLQQETVWSALKSFFGGKRSASQSDTQQRKSSTSSPQPHTIEELAAISDAPMAWNPQPDGSRERLWCKICRAEDRPWLTAEPCSHIKNAQTWENIPDEVVKATLAYFAEHTEQGTRRGE